MQSPRRRARRRGRCRRPIQRVPDYALDPFPRAWLPLNVGHEALGALCLRWSDDHAIREHDRRLLSVYANGAAMALQHAALYEQARIQAERDPVTDLYNHRAFHNRLETVLERAAADAASRRASC